MRNPEAHSDKTQYRKLFDRRVIPGQVSDKIEARTYVDSVLGAGAADRLMVPILTVADRFEDLDPALKNQDIMIKASHGSGWNKAVPANSDYDWQEAKRLSNEWTDQVYGAKKFEWSYRDLKRRLLVEPLLPATKGNQILGFKVYRYDGVIRFYMPEDNSGETTKYSVCFDDLTKMEASWHGIEDQPFETPVDFECMKAVARKVSAGFDTLRVDFLLQEDRQYLGELTLHDASGLACYDTQENDKLIGQFWKIHKDLNMQPLRAP